MGVSMQKIGEFWVPDIDALPGPNLDRSREGFEKRKGIQIHHLKKALELVPGRDVAVDGGANVGAWTREMALHFDHVHSFEPLMDAFQCLERNIEEWGLMDKVTLYAKAISDRRDFVTVAPKKAGARTVTSRISGPGPTECVSIDSLDLKACSFLKFDLEGHEANAIRGATNTMKQFKPWVLIENRRPKRPFGWIGTSAERELRLRGYRLVEKIGDHHLDWLYAPA